ncbi:MAG: hemolysin family protein [Planctomycetota bacterium]|nr:hemolysin family protein [Planctomycetota bacterium]
MYAAIMIVTMLLLLLLKGFFSGSEIALVNADKMHLTHRANHGHRGSQIVLQLFRTPEVLLTTTLVGTNLSTICLSTLGTLLMLDLVGEQYGDVVAFLVYTPIFLILGEIVPKSVYQEKSDTIAPLVVYPLKVVYFLAFPVVFVFSRIARVAARMSGGGAAGHGLFVTREQIRSVVEMAERGSNVGHFDRIRIRRAIRFAETSVGEAMVPIADVVAINCKRHIDDVIERVHKRGFNRLPVYEDNISNVVGVVTITTWDLMDPQLPQRSLNDLIRPAHYVTQYETIDLLLPVLKARADHMAIVVDEYGSAVGIITMEDVIEEVVGDIDVGYEFEEYLPKKRRRFKTLDSELETYEMDARLPISEVNDLLGLSLPANEFHTVAGLIIARLRRMPKQDESIVESGYRFTVSDMSNRSIRSVIVERERTEVSRGRKR